MVVDIEIATSKTNHLLIRGKLRLAGVSPEIYSVGDTACPRPRRLYRVTLRRDVAVGVAGISMAISGTQSHPSITFELPSTAWFLSILQGHPDAEGAHITCPIKAGTVLFEKDTDAFGIRVSIPSTARIPT